MADIPASVLAAAERAIIKAATDFGHDDLVAGSSRQFARAALDAAAPLLAEATLTPLAKRHAPLPDDWGGYYCGTCWVKGGSRASSPCAELLAIAAILPAAPSAPVTPEGAGNVSASSAATREDGDHG